MSKVRHGKISMILDQDPQSVNQFVEHSGSGNYSTKGGKQQHPFKRYDDIEGRLVEKYFTPD